MKLKNALEELGCDTSSSDKITRSTIANFRWEPAISNERADDYNDYIQDVANHKDWKGEHKSYLSATVHIPKDLPRSPDCFSSINHPAHLNIDMDDTYLIRLESLGYFFDNSLYSEVTNLFWTRFINNPKDLLKSSLGDSDEELREEFVSLWNGTRIQARPLFATFLNDFGGNIRQLVKEDWPHLLRDRLGLTHWSGAPGNMLPVALMCYTVSDVRHALRKDAAKGATSGFTRPTVLDAEMSAAFVPAPLMPDKGSYGYTLDLHQVSAPPEDFTPELLTYPIEYKPEHIKALGFIEKPHMLNDGDSFLNARNLHVKGLQVFSGNSSFGEVLK